MRKDIGLLVLGASVTVAAFAQQAAKIDFDGKTWWDYVKVLAADNMEGRETGSAVCGRRKPTWSRNLKQAGLQPAGINGYYQPVKFQSRQIVEKDSSLALIRDGKTRTAHPGRRRYLRHPHRSRARSRGAAGVRRIRPHHPRTKLRRSRRPRSQRQSRGHLHRLARRHSRGALVSLSVRRRALEGAAAKPARSASSASRIPLPWIFPGRASR